MSEQKPMSIEEINQLSGYCSKLQKQNKDLQSELREKKQELEELSSGVLMIAELLGIDVPRGEKTPDLISTIAATIEEQQEAAEKARKNREAIAATMGTGTIRANIEKSISGV